MIIGGIDFPRTLLKSLRERNLVLFAGAGVSMGDPANLPDFYSLAVKVASEISEIQVEEGLEDVCLGKLQDAERQNPWRVHEHIADLLSRNSNGKPPQPTRLHRNLLKLFQPFGGIKIVTTNFDLLFEKACSGIFDPQPVRFTAPALPLGREFQGIVHLHGTVDQPHAMVVTDRDFGSAYLVDGWARRFLVELFENYTVLFIGYGYNDTIVKYLSRSLPPKDDNHRYVLTHQPQKDQWRYLQIEPITYSLDENQGHSQLDVGIRACVKYLKRETIEWKVAIHRLAMATPEVPDEGEELFNEIFDDLERVSFFAESADDPIWFDVLANRGFLDGMFEDRVLTEPEKVLSNWIAGKFMFVPEKSLLHKVLQRNSYINETFWSDLCRSLANGNTLDAETTYVDLWVFTLISSYRSGFDVAKLRYVARICDSMKLHNRLAEIFSLMATFRLRLENIPQFRSSEANETQTPNLVGVDLKDASQFSDFSRLWENHLSVNLNAIAKPLLELIVNNLEARFQIIESCSGDSSYVVLFGFRYRSVGSLVQENVKSHVGLMIHAAKECLKSIQTTSLNNLDSWCDTYAPSKNPLIRRLVINSVSLREDLDADCKIEWVISRFDLYDVDLDVEYSEFLRCTFPLASRRTREMLIARVEGWNWPYPKKNDWQTREAYGRFQMLQKLLDFDPNCEQVKVALELALLDHPNFTKSASTIHLNPIAELFGTEDIPTEAELLEKPPRIWVERLLALPGERVMSHDFDEFKISLSRALKCDIEWSLNLASELSEREETNSYIWPYVLDSWHLVKANELEFKRVLEHLKHPSLLVNNARQIAFILEKISKTPSARPGSDLINSANEIAKDLWETMQGPDVGESYRVTVIEAINRPAGILADFWLRCADAVAKQQRQGAASLEEPHLRLFTEIIGEQSERSIIAKLCLCRRLSRLMEIDKNWTEKMVLPLFSSEQTKPSFRAAWQGFLESPMLPPNVAELMVEPFGQAIPPISEFLNSDGDFSFFYDCFIYFVTRYVDDPNTTWIPRFFDHVDESCWKELTRQIGVFLRNSNGSANEQVWSVWLRKYWENRNKGIPRILRDEEKLEMLTWLFELEEVLDQAMELAEGMECRELPYLFIDDLIDRQTMFSLHRESLANLLVNIGQHSHEVRPWFGIGRVTEYLLHGGVKPKLQLELKKLVTKFEKG